MGLGVFDGFSPPFPFPPRGGKPPRKWGHPPGARDAKDGPKPCDSPDLRARQAFPWGSQGFGGWRRSPQGRPESTHEIPGRTNNIKVKRQPDRKQVDQQGGRPEEHHPPNHHGQHADIHRVAYVSVRPANHQPFGRVDRCRRPTPERRKVPHSPEVHRRTHRERHERQVPNRSPPLSPTDPSSPQQPRHIHPHRPRHQQRKQQVFQEQKHKPGNVICAAAGRRNRLSPG